MWFKNLHLFRFSRPFNHTTEELEQALQQDAFTPCGSQDVAHFGWVKPLGKHGELLHHAASGQLLICARKEEKLLPATVVKNALEEKIEELEAAEGRFLKKKEKQALKEEILHTLLPRAFSRTSQTRAWINPEAGFIAVDASSPRKAEDLLSLLRKSLGSLPVVPVALTHPIEATMTEWMREGNLPTPFQLAEEAELRSLLDQGGVIRCKDQELRAEEMLVHLAHDKQVTKLALNWDESLFFVLTEEMALKRLKFSDELQQQNEDIPREEQLARLDADFALMTQTLNQLLPELLRALGGERREL